MSGVDRLAAYRQAGVDLDLSNVASQIAADWAQTTWGNRQGEFGEPTAIDTDFTSAKYLAFDEIRNRPDVVGVFGIDGAGTKPDFYERMWKFKGLGKDLIAMAADDNPIEGGQAVLVNNALIVSTLKDEYLPYISELFEGLAEGANEAGLVLFTGETAVHGDRLHGPTEFTVDWIGDSMGLVHKKRAITGAKVHEGDELWGLAQSNGFRCNGISAVRRAFKGAYGENWHLAPFGESTLGDECISPSTIYSGLMTRLTGGYKIEVEPKIDVHGAAHISGGSIPEKLGRMLRASELGADIDNLFEPPGIMKHAQEVTEVSNDDGTTRPMSDEEMITTWHGGQGYVLAINERDAEALQTEASKLGIDTQKIGHISKTTGIRVTSKGVQTPGKVMEF
ncbi:MAG: Phosphoribosylformylglycinamidine cyclo-ligase [Candidatus Saccharibacteria bacterium]|nr:Phosphoribosylformylglycinamidine cyclo-ligase [Candidatus Saccharibacteria bacterium]